MGRIQPRGCERMKVDAKARRRRKHLYHDQTKERRQTGRKPHWRAKKRLLAPYLAPGGCFGRSRIYSREPLPDVNARFTGFRERLPDVNARPMGFRERFPDVCAPFPTVNAGLTEFREWLPTVNGRLREVNPAGTELRGARTEACGATAKACGATAKACGARTKVNPRGRKGRGPWVCPGVIWL